MISFVSTASQKEFSSSSYRNVWRMKEYLVTRGKHSAISSASLFLPFRSNRQECVSQCLQVIYFAIVSFSRIRPPVQGVNVA